MSDNGSPPSEGLSTRVFNQSRALLQWIETRIPPGLRLLLGLLLMVGGVFGFLPVIGFWMFPLGVAVIALDIRHVREWLRNRR